MKFVVNFVMNFVMKEQTTITIYCHRMSVSSRKVRTQHSYAFLNPSFNLFLHLCSLLFPLSPAPLPSLSLPHSLSLQRKAEVITMKEVSIIKCVCQYELNLIIFFSLSLLFYSAKTVLASLVESTSVNHATIYNALNVS
jgi:hypothetical protein